MKTPSPFISSRTLLALCIVAFAASSATAQQSNLDDNASPRLRAIIEAGIASFHAARYDDAVASFRQATQLDPGNEKAHLYLATAYSVQVVPNLNTPENLKTASLALAEFDVLLRDHPDDLTAITQEAYIYRNIQQLDKAMNLEKRAIVIDPGNFEALFTIGVIDWTQAYKNVVRTLADEKLVDDGAGNTKLSRAACESLRALNTVLVEEAIASLTRAVELKPDYDDAMQYLNLSYRRRADLHCGESSSVDADVHLAEQWTQRAMQVRKESTKVKE